MATAAVALPHNQNLTSNYQSQARQGRSDGQRFTAASDPLLRLRELLQNAKPKPERNWYNSDRSKDEILSGAGEAVGESFAPNAGEIPPRETGEVPSYQAYVESEHGQDGAVDQEIDQHASPLTEGYVGFSQPDKKCRAQWEAIKELIKGKYWTARPLPERFFVDLVIQQKLIERLYGDDTRAKMIHKFPDAQVLAFADNAMTIGDEFKAGRLNVEIASRKLANVYQQAYSVLPSDALLPEQVANNHWWAIFQAVMDLHGDLHLDQAPFPDHITHSGMYARSSAINPVVADRNNQAIPPENLLSNQNNQQALVPQNNQQALVPQNNQQALVPQNNQQALVPQGSKPTVPDQNNLHVRLPSGTGVRYPYQNRQHPLMPQDLGPLVPYQNGQQQLVPYQNGQQPLIPYQNGQQRLLPYHNGQQQLVPYQNGQQQLVPYQNGQQQLVPYQNGQQQLVPYQNAQQQPEPDLMDVDPVVPASLSNQNNQQALAPIPRTSFQNSLQLQDAVAKGRMTQQDVESLVGLLKQGNPDLQGLLPPQNNTFNVGISQNEPASINTQFNPTSQPNSLEMIDSASRPNRTSEGVRAAPMNMAYANNTKTGPTLGHEGARGQSPGQRLAQVGSVAFVQQLGAGIRICLNIGTNQTPYHIIRSGSHFGKVYETRLIEGVRTRVLVEDYRHLLREHSRDTLDNQTLSQYKQDAFLLRDVVPLTTNPDREPPTRYQNVPLYFLVHFDSGQPQWLTKTQLGRVCGPRAVAGLTREVLKARNAVASQLQKSREAGVHPDTGHALTPQDTQSSPWLAHATFGGYNEIEVIPGAYVNQRADRMSRKLGRGGVNAEAQKLLQALQAMPPQTSWQSRYQDPMTTAPQSLRQEQSVPRSQPSSRPRPPLYPVPSSHPQGSSLELPEGIRDEVNQTSKHCQEWVRKVYEEFELSKTQPSQSRATQGQIPNHVMEQLNKTSPSTRAWVEDVAERTGYEREL